MQITVFAMLALLLLVKMLEKQEQNFKVHIEKIFQKVALANGKHVRSGLQKLHNWFMKLY